VDFIKKKKQGGEVRGGTSAILNRGQSYVSRRGFGYYSPHGFSAVQISISVTTK